MYAAGGQAGARGGRLGGFVMCGGDERPGVGVVRLHIQDPFAYAFHVFLRQAAVGIEDALDVGVDAALETVGGGRDAACGGGLAEREQRTVALQADEPVIGASQPGVGPPPCASGAGLGVAGVVACSGALADDVGVAGVPVVGQAEPGRGGVGVADLHESPGEPEQVLACVGAWPAGEVRARVAQHVHEAPLDPCVLPRVGGGSGASGAPVGDERARGGQLGEQPGVCRGAFGVAPLECDGRPVRGVDRDEQAPSVRHVRAVCLDGAAGRRRSRYLGFDMPAPLDATDERARRHPEHRGGLCKRHPAGSPDKERAEFGGSPRVAAVACAARAAAHAPPPLPARRCRPVLAHRLAAYRAQSRFG